MENLVSRKGESNISSDDPGASSLDVEVVVSRLVRTANRIVPVFLATFVRCCSTAVTVFLFPISVAMAGPWLDAGDLRLRHDLLLLADAGLIFAPLTSWPLSTDDIAQDLARTSAESLTSPMLRMAYARVQEILQRASVRDTVNVHFRLAAASELQPFRTFAETPRESAEATAGIAWQGERFFYRLNATAVARPDDDKALRGDGSYLGAQWGNWVLSAAAVDRWWGPGWNGSLILSSNARPVPAMAIQRNRSMPFETPLLSWIGPWQFTFLMGQLNGEATISYAKLMGMRLNIKPTPALEIGFSRTAQWGGQGRPEDFDTFINLLWGRDNVGSNGVTMANEPGNQLAGYDFRWVSPILNLPYAVYGQLIGEDQADGMLFGSPSRHIGLLGLEIWRSESNGVGSGRLYMEYADTVCDFLRSSPRYGCAYEHGVYRSGYRYYGLSLGHSLDGDGRMTSVGYVRVAPFGNFWEALVRKIEPNRDAFPSEKILDFGLTYTLVNGSSSYVIEAGLARGWGTGMRDFVEGRLGLQWRRTF